MTFIDNKRVTCDNYGNLIEQVFYDDVHLNNKIGTKKLVTNVKYHLGLNGRNFESLQLPRNRRVFARIPNGPRENSTITSAEEGTITIKKNVKIMYENVYLIGHSPSGLFRTNANNDKLIFK